MIRREIVGVEFSEEFIVVVVVVVVGSSRF